MRVAAARGALALWLVLGTTALASAQVAFVHGPTLMDLRADSVVVEVEAPTPVAVTVDATVGGEVKRFVSTAQRRHFVRLAGLPRDSVVHYTVTAPGFRSESGTFRTPPPPTRDAVDFLAYGDNRDGDAPHASLVRRMATGPGDFVLHLGDVIPRGRSDAEWNTFLRIANPILRDRPLVPVLGNHEIADGARARARYFAHVVVPAPPATAFHRFDYGPVRILSLDSNAPMSAGSPQHTFVARETGRIRREASPPLLVVGIHHGPYSSGHHGGLEDLRSSGVLQMLRGAGAALVLSGHDHIYERGQVRSLKYIVTGGGGSPLYTANRREKGQLAFVPEFHYLALHATRTTLAVDALRPDGSAIERCRFTRGGRFACGAGGERGPMLGEAPAAFYLGHRIARTLGLVFGIALVLFLARRLFVLSRREGR